MPRTLYVAISSHGFGHVGQTAPVVNELWRRLPDLRVLVRTAAPPALLGAHLSAPFQHLPGPVDIGMVMASSLDVRVEESYAAYRALHREWERHLRVEAAQLAALRPDLVLANVPYALPAAAARVRVPAVLLCSLNWGEVFKHYCGAMPAGEAIHRQILEGYQSADLFLNPEPSMPMRGLANLREVGPIARQGRNRRNEVNRRLGLSPHDKLVLLFLGGITTPVPVDRWPRLEGIHVLVAGAPAVDSCGISNIDALGMPYIDVLCSVDAIVTKPGYGSFVEAACNGIPVLYTRRGDWAEEPHLVAWLKRHSRCVEVDRPGLEAGRLLCALERVWGQASPPATPMPTGVAGAASALEPYLRG